MFPVLRARRLLLPSWLTSSQDRPERRRLLPPRPIWRVLPGEAMAIMAMGRIVRIERLRRLRRGLLPMMVVVWGLGLRCRVPSC